MIDEQFKIGVFLAGAAVACLMLILGIAIGYSLGGP